MSDADIKDLVITVLPIKKLRQHPDNEAMWGSKNKDVEALAKTIKKTQVIDPLLVMEATDGNWLILSGHSRYEAAKSLGIKNLPCRAIKEALNETEQLLWIIAFNTGHATDKKRILKAALYCAEKNKGIDTLAMLDFCGAGEEAERWSAAIDKVTQIIIGSGKNKPRIKKTAQDSAGEGIQALEVTVKKSEAKTGTQNASSKKHSSDFSDRKPIDGNDLQEKDPRKPDDLNVPISGSETPLAESFVVEVAEIPKISEAEAPKPASGIKATVKLLNRDMYAAGMLETKQAKFAIETLLALAEGEQMPDAPSRSVIEGLNKRVEEWMEVARTNILEYEAAIEDVNTVFKKWMAQPVNGQVMVPAHAVSEPFIKRGLETMKNMDPEILASQAEAQ